MQLNESKSTKVLRIKTHELKKPRSVKKLSKIIADKLGVDHGRFADSDNIEKFKSIKKQVEKQLDHSKSKIPFKIKI